jgi:hypothetical protein
MHISEQGVRQPLELVRSGLDPGVLRCRNADPAATSMKCTCIQTVLLLM